MWRAFIVNCFEYRRKSLISRGGHIRITLLRQTLIICNITVPIYFHISPIIQFSRCEPQNSRRHSPYPKTEYLSSSPKLDKRAESTRRNHTTMQNPVMVSPQCYAGHPAETKDSTLCRM